MSNVDRKTDGDKVIQSCRITAMPKSMFDPMPEVHVQLEGDTEEKFLFSYYPDEISFSADEFLGKTVAEAGQMRHNRDVAYIRS